MMITLAAGIMIFLTCKVVNGPGRFFILYKIFKHLCLESLDMSQPLQPVGGVGIIRAELGSAEDVGREVAVERHLPHLPGEVWVGDGPGRGQVSQLRLQLRFADHADPVTLEIQGLN